MEKRAVLAIVLSLLVIVVWTYVVAPPPSTDVPPLDKPIESVEQGVQDERETAPSLPPRAAESGSPASTAVAVTVDTGKALISLTAQGAGVKDVKLLDYRTTLDEDAPPVTIAQFPGAATVPLEAQLRFNGRTILLRRVVFTSSSSEIRLSPSQPEATVSFRGETDDGMVVRRTYRFQHDSYVFQVSTWVEGLQPSAEDTMTRLWGPGLLGDQAVKVKRRGQIEPTPRHYVSKKIFNKAPKAVGETQVERGEVSWAALGDAYFAAVLIPQEPPADATIVRRVREDALEVGIRTPLNGEQRQTVRVYVGPKTKLLLEQVEPSLGKLIDLGFFSPMARPMLQLLIFLNNAVHNYGVTIILVTILIKIAFWPLTHKSYKSMQAMQKVQPKMKELQAMYKDDKQGLNRAMMQLYRDEKVNPMGGCLPMVLQIPVFFAFYNALLYSIELRHAPFICWETPIFGLTQGICDLSVHDPTYITPILMGVSMFFQQKMTPTSADPMQAKIMRFMPLMFLIFFLTAPAGLVVYWLVNNVLSIAQQLLINRVKRQEVVKTEVASKE